MEERDKIIEKALKLRELALRGVDGEKETAQRMFDTFKQKHSITDEELDSASLKSDSEYFNMTADEFFKHIEVDIQMLGYSMIIFSLGTIFKNNNVKNIGVGLFKEAVKLKENKNKEE